MELLKPENATEFTEGEGEGEGDVMEEKRREEERMKSRGRVTNIDKMEKDKIGDYN